MYSKKVNEALERYGARTHGSLERRVERLKRFTDMTNKRYAQGILNEIDKREKARKQTRISFVEPKQEVEIPMASGLDLLWKAIQNGHVKTNRG